MSDTATLERPARTAKATKPTAPTAPFIFIGDPMDSGRGSRARRDDDDIDTGTYCKLYGFKFPLGKTVQVPLDAKLGVMPPASSMLVIEKLRGNRHFFEGTEDELADAKKSGEIKFAKAPEKTPVLIKFKGMRLKRVPGSKAMEPVDEAD